LKALVECGGRPVPQRDRPVPPGLRDVKALDASAVGNTLKRFRIDPAAAKGRLRDDKPIEKALLVNRWQAVQ
jgi:hypothetical protein